MKLPNYPDDCIIGLDRFRNAVVIRAIGDGDYELSISAIGILLSPALARKLGKRLLEFADSATAARRNTQ